MTITEYINELNKEYKTGRATEHSYRGYLQNLIKSIVPSVMVTNEPIRIKCGAPDYIITKNDIPVGYIEAKDLNNKLDDKHYKEQFDRYRKSLTNLIITDYIDFWLYIDGEFIRKIRIGEVVGGVIKTIPENHQAFINLIRDFCTYVGQTIKSSRKLAEMMAGKARMLSEVIEKALLEDEADIFNPDTPLQAQLHAFKDVLIHDITAKGFADIYSQTIAYGMFAARLHDNSLSSFSRQEAAELIPKTNPFLRKLFQYIAGYDLDQRIVWIVDGLAEIFRATDVAALLKNFGKSTQANDPIIHFYETFLSEYDPALRKARGVWYTPGPVVNFIVRAVNDVLKTEFELKDGLADTSKTKIKAKIFTKATSDQRSKIKEEFIEKDVHKVQILDPATGTGTFLAEIIKLIYKAFEGQQGIWSNYVDNHLIPRLNGFELLMASYAMAHLKIDLLLKETGYVNTAKNEISQQRFKIYLTNSLEEHHKDTGTLLANWLSTEANEANQIKRDTPVMVIIGNPPYSGESNNKSEWIMNLMEDYKKEPGGNEKLKERNPKWINDDYVKFLRFGQFFIEKNGTGVLAFINPHGFLDNPTFRGVRWSLLKAYDKIYTIDLHGNSKKKEKNIDGGVDQNVFDIMQGVSINLFIKTGKKVGAQLATVLHYDLFGKREYKYDFLLNHSIHDIAFKEIPNKSPMYFMVQKNFASEDEYNKGIKLNNLFKLSNVGIVTARDNFTIHKTISELEIAIKTFLNLDDETARARFNLGKDVRDWKISYAKNDLRNNYPNKGKVCELTYRPFDNRYTFFTGNSKGFHCYPRTELMKHFLDNNNVGLVFKLGNAEEKSVSAMVSNRVIDFRSWSRPGMQGGDYLAPLYIYSDKSDGMLFSKAAERKHNLNTDIIKKIAKNLDLRFTDEKENTENTFSPIDILDYIYAVLHSPIFIEKYREFLKTDFPSVPYPKNVGVFFKLVNYGEQLRKIHLFESDIINKYITKYPVIGNNIIDKLEYLENKIYINDNQYFDNIPQNIWEFYIGGYQPAQKWLKDRRNCELNFEDISHYQKIIVAISETIRLKKELETVVLD